MRFTTSRRIEGAYSGRHLAKQRGGSGEFVDFREYSPGDDLRRLDWKAMGRTERSYLKLFQDETDLRCTVLIDASGSMLQSGGERTNLTKIEWAQYFSSALSYLVLLGRDAVGLGVARESLSEYLAPSSAYSQQPTIHEMIASIEASGKTDLAQSLDDLLVQSRRRGVLLVLSDFLSDNSSEVLAKLRVFRARGWEIVALHLVHPTEIELPAGSAIRFMGLEDDGQVNCQVAEIRSAYKKRFAEHLLTVRNSLVGVGCEYHQIMTNESYVECLRTFLVARGSV